MGAYPAGIAYNPVNGLLYVTNFGSSNISVVDPSTNAVIAWIPMPFGIDTLAVDTSNGMVYTAETVYRVYAINATTNQVEWTIPLLSYGCPYGCAPHVQVFDPANGDVYVTDLTSDNVSVIHGNAVVAVIPVGSGPNGAAYDGANGDVYVSNEGACQTCILNLTAINGTANRVVGQVSGAGGGPGVAYASSNGDIYTCTNGASNNFTNFVSVANGSTNTVVASIPMRSGCGSALYDPNNGYVYITDRYRLGQELSNVTVIDPSTNRIVLTQPVQLGPIGSAYDPANHNVYVADSDTNNISVLPQITRLAVHETGLPTGTNWSATVGGTSQFSTTPTIYFPEESGMVNYSIGREANLTATPASGGLQVSGGEQWLNVSFSKGGGGSGLLGLPGATGYYVLVGIGALAAILIAAVVIVSRRRERGKPPGPQVEPSPPTEDPRR